MFNDLVLLSIAPNAERPVYFGFLNTLAGIASLTLPVGGLILEYLGYTPLFLLSGILALFSLIVGLGIERPAMVPRNVNATGRAIRRARIRGRLMVAMPLRSVQQLFQREP
jgi:hypothetical protein